MDSPGADKHSPAVRPADSPPSRPPQLKIELGGAGWVLLLAGLLGVYLLLKLTWPLLSGEQQARPLEQTPAELGFDLSNSLVPQEQIISAAPPGSIPPLVMPKTVPGSEAAALTKEFRRKYHHKFVVDGDRVIGVTLNGESRAYQLKILQWHEVANDVLGGVPIAVTYSPLTDSVLVFDRRVGNDVIVLAASGMLYNSNSLLYEQVVGSVHVDHPALGGMSAVETGERWYTVMGCKQCHSLDGSAGDGPTFKNLYGNQVKLADGSSVLADSDYIRTSILDPAHQRVAGFEREMPVFEGRLTEQSINNIFAFLKSLSDATPAAERETLLAERDAASTRPQQDAQSAEQEAYRAVPAEWNPEHSSLWSQLGRNPISGWAAGTNRELTPLPCEVTHWGDWLARYPDTTLLSHDTGHSRKYTINAYGAYYDRMKLRFPVESAPSGDPHWQFTRAIAVQQPDGAWRSYDYPALKAQAEQDGLRFVYEPFAAGMEPDSARLDGVQQPVVYGLQFALETFGYMD